MNEKLLTKINQLTMNNPSIDLMEEDSVAAIEDLGKHNFDNRVTRNTSLVNRVKKFTTLKAKLFNFLD